MRFNPMHTTLNYDKENTIYLTNIENVEIVDLFSFPCPEWGDRKTLAGIVRELGKNKGWC